MIQCMYGGYSPYMHIKFVCLFLRAVVLMNWTLPHGIAVVSQAKTLLANVKNATAADRTQTKTEKKQLMKDISDLEKEVTDLNKKYNAEFQVPRRIKSVYTYMQ